LPGEMGGGPRRPAPSSHERPGIRAVVLGAGGWQYPVVEEGARPSDERPVLVVAEERREVGRERGVHEALQVLCERVVDRLAREIPNDGT